MAYMGQSKEEVFKVFFPQARVVFHPGGSGMSSLMVGDPRPDLDFGGRIGSYSCLSKSFPLDSAPEPMWDDAYERLLERAQILIKDDAARRASLQP